MLQNLTQEQLGALMLGIVKERMRLFLLDNLPLIHEDHPTGKAIGYSRYFWGDLDYAG